MRWSVVFLLCIGITFSTAQEKGAVIGKITDKELNNDPLPFANVLIKGTTKGTTTNTDGLYEIKQVDPGTYTLVISFIGYETLEIPNVNVVSEKVTEVNTGLGAGNVSLDEVVVSTVARRDSEIALLLEQKKAVEIKQSIGAQELSRKGVSDVEQGLTKISGISKQESKGVIVRGLDDRYNFLTVNGLPFLSADPDKKIIPLDKFSTNLVRNIDVYKTFNPAIYGDFAGASVDIITKDYTAKPVTAVKLGFSGNSQTSFKNFKIDRESASETFGINGSSRSLPGRFGRSVTGIAPDATSSESRDLFATGFNFSNETAYLGNSLEVSHSNTTVTDEDKGKTLGYYISFGFNNDYNTKPGILQRSLNTAGEFNSNYTGETYTFSTQKSSLLSLRYNLPEVFKLTLNNIFLQTTENALTELFGLNQEADDNFFFRNSRYRQTTVNHVQLLGDWNMNTAKAARLKFGTSFGLGYYKEPDRKIFRAEGRGENARLFTSNNGNPFRFYADLEIYDIGGFAEYSLGFGTQNEDDKYNNTISIGGDMDFQKYDYFNRAIRLGTDISLQDVALNTDDPDGFITTGFNNDYLFYEDVSDASKFAEIEQLIAAGYVTYNYVINQWDFTFGVRGEISDRTIFYREFTTPFNDPFLQARNNPLNIIPSLNIKRVLNDNSNIRLAGAVTTTRPRIREILPILYANGDFTTVAGNENLENSTNYNLDIKYEYFMDGGGLFALTAFGKYIDKPIETVLEPIAGGRSLGFQNSQEATVLGAEIEYTTTLDKIFGEAVEWENFRFGFNGSLMYTNTKIAPENTFLTSNERKLQGASPWLINSDLSYSRTFNNNWESMFTLAYNVYGERIFALGANNLYDAVEKPFHQLDLIWRNEIGKMSFGISFKNILNDTFRVTQIPSQLENAPETDIYSFKKGVDLSLSIGYTFN